MGAIAGKQLGSTTSYRGHTIAISYYGPDLLAYVDEQQVGDFWVDVASAERGAKAYIDRVEDQKAKEKAKAAKA